MRRSTALAVLALILPGAAQAGPPIIDMHLHAFRLDGAAGALVCTNDQNTTIPPIDPKAGFDPSAITACDHPVRAPDTDVALMDQSLAQLRKHDIRRAVASGAPADVAVWRAAAPDRIIPAIGFATSTPIYVAELKRLHAQGDLAVLAEVSTQYRGVSADDPRYEPFFAMAEALDIPVGIHLGEGPPAAGRFPGYETYRAALTTPFQLEAVLRRHPRLRIYVMHYGSPLVDEMIAMMFSYPNLYVDIACNNWLTPRAKLHADLKRMVDAGFGQRIMWGSDQMLWPDVIGPAIESVEHADFLTQAQKRDIFYNNAARFLRLSEAEIAADHRPLAAP